MIEDVLLRGAEPDPFVMLPFESELALLISSRCVESCIYYGGAHRNLIIMLFGSHCLN